MNERIKELSKQAWAWAEKQDYTDPTQEFSDILEEKFAELIIRECIEQLVQEGNDWEEFSRNPPRGQETNASAALFAAYRLKEDAVGRLEEHFGVE